MKIKRRLTMLALVATMLLSTVIVAHAAGSTGAGSRTVYSERYDMSLYGYIDFIEGVLWFRDDYRYNVSFAGRETYYIPYPDSNVYVQLSRVICDEDDNIEYEDITKIFPYYGRTYLSTVKTYGYGASYAKLDIQCYDVKGTVIGK